MSYFLHLKCCLEGSVGCTGLPKVLLDAKTIKDLFCYGSKVTKGKNKTSSVCTWTAALEPSAPLSWYWWHVCGSHWCLWPRLAAPSSVPVGFSRIRTEDLPSEGRAVFKVGRDPKVGPLLHNKETLSALCCLELGYIDLGINYSLPLFEEQKYRTF